MTVTNLLNDIGSPRNKLNRLLLYCSFSAFFLAFRLSLIKCYGTPTPFWDQWDGEAVGIYKPFLDGTLDLKRLLDTHNEHRIFTTRLLALILFYFNNDIWNPMLQMVVNAFIQLLGLLLLNALICKVVDWFALPALLLFSLIIFGIPYGWENILCGFQAQFYFVILFSILAIWLLLANEPFGKSWWMGLTCGVLGFFSLASGVFIFATTAFVGALFYLLKLRQTKQQLSAFIVLGMLFITGVLLTPVLAHQAVYKAHTIPDFYHALKSVFGWPVGWNLLAVAIRNLPMAIYIIYILKKRPAASDKQWFLFALCVWSVIQAISLAYGRAMGVMAPRYKDLYTIPVFLNFVCLIFLLRNSVDRRRRDVLVGMVSWMTILLVSVGNNSITHLPSELASKLQENIESEKNTRNYIATGDIKHLQNKERLFIPFSDPYKLAELINLAGVKEFLPTNISHPLKAVSVDIQPAASFAVNGYLPSLPKAVDPAWGSYANGGDAAMGRLTVHFKTNWKGRKIGIPVAGYPLQEGIKLEIEQNGKRNILPVKSNPGRYWGAAYTTLSAGDFSIHLTDSSTAAWVAAGTPFAFGRLDDMTTRFLGSYHIFLVTGIVIAVVLVTLACIDNKNKILGPSA